MKMPQQKNPFGRLVAAFREYIEIDNPSLQACKCDSYASVHNKVANLTKEDLYVLANNKLGATYVGSLYDMKIFALKTKYNPKSGKEEFTDNAKFALAALKELKPANVNLVDYLKMIDEVAENTKTVRAQIEAQIEKEYGKPKKATPSTSTKTSVRKVSAAVFESDHGITLDPQDHNGFDQQKALELLAERGVKVDSDQSLKTPNFEQEALKAVASLKNTVLTRAA
jgi:hypothetical protein